MKSVSTISGSTVHQIQLTSDEETPLKEAATRPPDVLMEHKQTVKSKQTVLATKLSPEHPEELETGELSVPNNRKRRMSRA